VSHYTTAGKKSDNPLNPDYVPNLFAYLSLEQRQRKTNCYKKFEQTQAVKRKRSCTSDVSMLPHGKYTGNEMDHSDSFPESGQIGEHSYCKDPIHTESSVACSDEACRETVKKLTEECTRLRAEVYQLRDRVSKLSFQQEGLHLLVRIPKGGTWADSLCVTFAHLLCPQNRDYVTLCSQCNT